MQVREVEGGWISEKSLEGVSSTVDPPFFSGSHRMRKQRGKTKRGGNKVIEEAGRRSGFVGL